MTNAAPSLTPEQAAFLKASDWDGARVSPITGDASTRAYKRLRKDNGSALLMIAPPAAEAPAASKDASEEERAALGYNAMARLAGPNLQAFVSISDALRGAGIAAPEIYDVDAALGLALIEDLGDALFARAIVEGADPTALYTAAIETLVLLAEKRVAPPKHPQYEMLDYDRVALLAEAQLLLEYYWPHVRGAKPSDDLVTEYSALWGETLDRLSTTHILTLRDFHAENLLWRPENDGVNRVGVIDFQDGLFGHAAYDVASLLEDARRDVEPAFAGAMLDQYITLRRTDPEFDENQFRSDYAILTAQRNAKILGIFARLANRDGKTRYLDFLPRVEGYFRADLARPALAPLADFFRRHLPGIAP